MPKIYKQQNNWTSTIMEVLEEMTETIICIGNYAIWDVDLVVTQDL